MIEKLRTQFQYDARILLSNSYWLLVIPLVASQLVVFWHMAVAAVVRDVRREARIRLSSEQSIEQLAPIDVLERYLRQARQMPEERVRRLLELASTIVGPGQSSG
mgnify:CR=1 FL=1